MTLDRDARIVESGEAPDSGASPSAAAGKQPVRAIDEDDDGYDPYTDFHDQPASDPLFEEDPWR